MSCKVILSVTGIDHGETDLKIAAALARQINAHLTLLVVGLAAPPPIGEYAAMISDAWMEERKADLARLEERVGALGAFKADYAPSADLKSRYSEVAFADEAIGENARYADLTVAGPELLAGDVLRSKVIEGVLFVSGQPLLLVPSKSDATLRPKRVVVAWIPTREASRAVHDAMWMLEGAEEVHIVMIDPEAAENGEEVEPGDNIATFLTRHGAQVVLDRLPSMGQSVEDVLRRHVADIDAELLVMGAYGHSRLRERMFGGVTRSMLEETRVPVLMAR